MKDERLVQDALICDRQLAIVEKYEDFLNYIYNPAHNIPRRHSVMRDMFLEATLNQVRLFAEAGKSSQVSKLHAADAGLATLRFYLRFMAHADRRLISKQQHKVASIHLAEVGKMLGAWIRTHGGKKGVNGESGNWNSNAAGPRQSNNNNPGNNWNNIGARGRCDTPCQNGLTLPEGHEATGADLTNQGGQPVHPA